MTSWRSTPLSRTMLIRYGGGSKGRTAAVSDALRVWLEARQQRRRSGSRRGVRVSATGAQTGINILFLTPHSKNCGVNRTLLSLRDRTVDNVSGDLCEENRQMGRAICSWALQNVRRIPEVPHLSSRKHWSYRLMKLELNIVADVCSSHPTSNLSALSLLLEGTSWLTSCSIACKLSTYLLQPTFETGFRCGYSTETAACCTRCMSESMPVAEHGDLAHVGYFGSFSYLQRGDAAL